MANKICIITHSHLCRNPRVLKEAIALHNAGFDVTVIHNTYDSLLTKEDRSLLSGTNIKLIAVAQLEHGSLSTFLYKSFKKLGDVLVRNFKIQSPLSIGYAISSLKRAALRQNAQLYIGHQEAGLYCGVQLLKAGKKVAFDFEDWYSEDLLEEARITRPLKLLKNAEKTALQKGAFCITTSLALAEQLAAAYQSNKPGVVYNTFDLDKRLIRPKTFDPPIKLFWFSQTIGPGRGLEEFIELITGVTGSVELHLLGQVEESFKDKLSGIQNRHPLYFHPLVPADLLPVCIAECDAGLALELDEPPSRKYTITNKLFQYMLSGLPVIATNTPGQCEIIGKHGGGILIDMKNKEETIAALQALVTDRNRLQSLRSEAVVIAGSLNWQHEQTKILDKVKEVLNTANG
jgi:glycosyltransferase involved in cell wall biosynthesis